MPRPALELPESDDPNAIAEFLDQLPRFERIWCSERSRLDGRSFAARSFPHVQELSYLGCASLVEANAFFAALPALRMVSFWTSAAHDEIDASALTALASSACWQKLDSLELTVAYRGIPFESLDGWEACWTGKSMAVAELSLSGLSLKSIAAIWKAEFPNLVRLKVGPALTDALLDQLLEQANLPHLEVLDVRFNGITGEGLQRFGARARERFPKLHKLGIEFYTGEKEEDYDWNGAVVQSFDVQYSPEAITEMYLKGTGIEVVQL